MANILKPLQIACNQQVLEQDNEFFFIVSATIGVRLSSGDALLEFDFFKEAFEHMGDRPMPDMGMPKPQAEYIVSGSFYSPTGKPVTGGEVKVKIGDNEKRLFVFGPRQWAMRIPTQPEPITSVPLAYSKAYGGNGYEHNPDGMGYDDINLPLIETPDQILTSNRQNIPPAGFAPLDPSLPQRMQYPGTYDETYLEKYYPGYPADFDWRFFMTTAYDQWQEEFFSGNESFELHNLHPEKTLIKGKLPGYKVRCFFQQELDEKTRFKELELNLDTVWFFPDTDLALLIWRDGLRVNDDEASNIKNILLAYECTTDTLRSTEYYQAALEKRLNSDDSLLNNFNTSDLIPVGAKCAMELLQETALVDTGSSPFSDNLDAKATSVQNQIDEKMKEVNEQLEKRVEFPDKLPGDEQDSLKEQINMEELLKKPSEIKPDSDIVALNKKLEAILPGVTAGDAKKINLKEFSFNKIDEIMAVVDEFRDGKQANALQEVENAKKALLDNSSEQMNNLKELPDEEKSRVKSVLDGLYNHEIPRKPPMPRIDLEEIQQGMSQLSPQMAESMQQLETLKALGGDDESIRNAEKMLSDILKQQGADTDSMLQEAESSFREAYIMGAHNQPHCSSPHKEDHAVIIERLMQRVKKKQDVSNGDWACLDLSGKVLDGTDFSGAFLEQVDFTNASLKGCNFAGAILARAILNNADCNGANFDHANLGAVTAHKTDFTSAHFTETILSNSDFRNSIFHRAFFEGGQILEINIDGADFSHCDMEGFYLIKLKFENTVFKEAQLSGSIFVECHITGCDFNGATLPNTIWANSSLVNNNFDHADLTSNSFSASEEEPVTIEGLSFVETNLEKANFQKLSMPRSNFRKANIQNANFGETEIKQADFSHTNAKQALFRKAVLTHSNFDHANIMEGIMTKAYLSGASFRHANLYAVDFLRSTMGETDFTGANLDNTIIRDWQPS